MPMAIQANPDRKIMVLCVNFITSLEYFFIWEYITPLHFLCTYKMLSFIVWNPDRNFFVIPYLHHPVTWYGFLFALGFLSGYFWTRKLFTEFLKEKYKTPGSAQNEATLLTDRLALLMVLGIIIGARLGHVFFYGWNYYSVHPWDILKIWEGGLASHGGALGGFLALLIFIWKTHKTYPEFTFLVVLDTLVMPSAFIGGCIRIGNFINQEITGTPTSLPWGVIFVRPMDGIAGIPLHPTQLYESFFYFLVFLALVTLWICNRRILGKGLLSGWFFVLVFGFRFIIEYLKTPQNDYFDTENWLRMGQLLSLPFIAFGAFLLVRYYGFTRKKT